MEVMVDDAWKRVATLVRTRRGELRISQEQLAREIGTTDRLIRSVEHAERATVSPSTLRALCIALGWTPDSIDRILDGLEPVEAKPQAEVDEAFAEIRERLDAIEAALGIPVGGRKQRDPAAQAARLAAGNKAMDEAALARVVAARRAAEAASDDEESRPA